MNSPSSWRTRLPSSRACVAPSKSTPGLSAAASMKALSGRRSPTRAPTRSPFFSWNWTSRISAPLDSRIIGIVVSFRGKHCPPWLEPGATGVPYAGNARAEGPGEGGASDERYHRDQGRLPALPPWDDGPEVPRLRGARRDAPVGGGAGPGEQARKPAGLRDGRLRDRGAGRAPPRRADGAPGGGGFLGGAQGGLSHLQDPGAVHGRRGHLAAGPRARAGRAVGGRVQGGHAGPPLQLQDHLDHVVL